MKNPSSTQENQNNLKTLNPNFFEFGPKLWSLGFFFNCCNCHRTNVDVESNSTTYDIQVQAQNFLFNLWFSFLQIHPIYTWHQQYLNSACQTQRQV
jgi:hypothetical protein